MTAPVLAVACLDDPTTDLVLDELHGRGIPVVRFDPGADFPDEIALSAHFDGSGMTGSIDTPTHRLDLSGVRAVYWRQPTPYRPSPDLDTSSASWAAEQARYGLGGVLAALPGTFYLNHPFRNRDAEYKPLQLATAAACGLAIPRTLITNRQDSVRRFASRSDGTVFKPLWSTPFKTDNGKWRTIWAHPIDPEEVDGTVTGAAHLFQEQVKKAADVRVTMVGDHVFPVRIDGSPALDWRLHYDSLSYQLIEATPAVVKSMRAYLDRLGLVFGAFDFCLFGDEWVFLECNPNGQWAWFDDPIPQQIAGAIADVLIRAKGES
ncbi:ATP-grasp ribosomal peptide maturase [Nonomuraea glycinis]|uniref:ATP-grasp ribosomal peptide maturase n=1 Tax=Nonomuraea glycinis TaxID=2047744 RepID=A0A918E3T7_9ACTN|nr:ATP-grasp ribosomal peptide maturase [Nonomuraea glycinis]MCA2175449.1 ATP-grasp ribosomal peptide maturase [Nonomuraea glycinis]GGP04743.1 ATP-grasp ribosomal peptide maturase [Nonomuraea glycinis]